MPAHASDTARPTSSAAAAPAGPPQPSPLLRACMHTMCQQTRLHHAAMAGSSQAHSVEGNAELWSCSSCSLRLAGEMSRPLAQASLSSSAAPLAAVAAASWLLSALQHACQSGAWRANAGHVETHGDCKERQAAAAHGAHFCTIWAAKWEKARYTLRMSRVRVMYRADWPLRILTTLRKTSGLS